MKVFVNMNLRRQRCSRQHLSFAALTALAMAFVVGCAAAAASDDQTQRREIASISASQLNRNRNLRQAYDGNGAQYSEIFPQEDSDYNVKRNGTDNRKPSFYACKDYAPILLEEQPHNTFVVKVEAHDPDRGDEITYSFEKSALERVKFRINEKTGDIYTSYTFDRDEPLREKEVCAHFSSPHPSWFWSLSFRRSSHWIRIRLNSKFTSKSESERFPRKGNEPALNRLNFSAGEKNERN